ncbi:non-specific serine/threonine protein kinase [Trifolium repens]|nr:non-specific serine/threonine protein kinase [Trifolium repens]
MCIICLLSPSLLFDTGGTGKVNALQELFSGDGEQMPLPPSIRQRLMSSSSALMNLSPALTYHKMYVPSVFASILFLPNSTNYVGSFNVCKCLELRNV